MIREIHQWRVEVKVPEGLTEWLNRHPRQYERFDARILEASGDAIDSGSDRYSELELWAIFDDEYGARRCLMHIHCVIYEFEQKMQQPIKDGGYSEVSQGRVRVTFEGNDHDVVVVYRGREHRGSLAAAQIEGVVGDYKLTDSEYQFVCSDQIMELADLSGDQS